MRQYQLTYSRSYLQNVYPLLNGKTLHLIEVDLSYLDLRDIDFAKTVFERCSLEGCNTHGSNLTDTTFIDVVLYGSFIDKIFKYKFTLEDTEGVFWI